MAESSIDVRLATWSEKPIAQRGGLRIVPLPIKHANVLVGRWHRHHKPVHGALFALGAAHGNELVGAAIVGRPVARMEHDGGTAEVVRLVTNGTKNACSILYAAAARTWGAMGGTRILTYVLASESGVSLRAAGWRRVGTTSDKAGWDRPPRRRAGEWLGPKVRWERALNGVVAAMGGTDG